MGMGNGRVGLLALALVYSTGFAADIDVSAAQAKYDRDLREYERTQANVATEEANVNDAQTKLYNAMEFENQAQADYEVQRQALTQIENELPVLHNQLRILQQNIATYKNQQNQAIADLRDSEQQVPGLENEIRRLQNEIDRLQQQINSETAKIAPIQSQINTLERKENEIQRALNSLQKDLAPIAGQISSAQNDIRRLENQIATEKTKTGPDQGKINSLEAQKSGLERQIDQLESSISTLNSNLQSTRRAIQEKTREIAQEKSKLGPTESKINQLEREVARAQREVQQAQNKLNRAKQQEQRAQADINRLEADIAEEKGKPNPSEIKIKLWERQLDNARNDLQDAQKDAAAAERELSQAQSELNSAQNELSSLQNSVGPILQAIAALEREKSALESQENSLEQQIRSAQSQITQAKSSINSIEREIAVEKNKEPADQNKIAAWERQIDQLESRISQLQGEKSQLESAIASKSSELSGVQSEIRSLEASIAPIKQTIANLNSHQNGFESQQKQKETELRNVRQHIAELRRFIQDVGNSIQNSQNELAQTQSLIDSHPRRLAEQRRITDRAFEQFLNYQQATKIAQMGFDEAQRRYEFAQNEMQRAYEVAQSSYAYLQQVIANYEAAKQEVIEAASQKGYNDGAAEAQARAGAAGQAAGTAEARRLGNELGTKAARAKAHNEGYRQGRKLAQSDAELKVHYDKGFKEGVNNANAKAQAEDMPKGYNEALATLIANAPAGVDTIDISEALPETPGETNQILAGTGKVPGSVTLPEYPLPVDAPYQLPQNPGSQVNVPPQDSSHFTPNCNGLSAPEFAGVCRDTYSQYYTNGYQTNYQSLYADTFDQYFQFYVKEAYDTALAQTFPDVQKAAMPQGAHHQGIVDGMRKQLPVAQSEQFAAGKQLLGTELQSASLIVVRKAELRDANNDGAVMPGEEVKLALIVDNYGASTAKLSLKALVQEQSGIEGLNFTERELPSLPARSRTTILGVASGRVVVQSAGVKLSLAGRVVTSETGKEIGKFTAETVSHYPLELTDIVLSKKPRVNEAVSAQLKFKNQTREKLPATAVNFTVSPKIATPGLENLNVASLAAGQETVVNTTIAPGVWVGENMAVRFKAKSKISDTELTQEFFKIINIDRTASAVVYDAAGKDLFSSRIRVKAGSKVTFDIAIKGHKAAQGVFRLEHGKTSDPSITLAPGLTVATQVQNMTATYLGSKIRLVYNVPQALAGKTAWIMCQLTQNGQLLHAPQINLDIE